MWFINYLIIHLFDKYFLGAFLWQTLSWALQRRRWRRHEASLTKGILWRRRLTPQHQWGVHCKQTAAQVQGRTVLMPAGGSHWGTGGCLQQFFSTRQKLHWDLNLEVTELKIRFIRRLSNQNNSRQKPVGDDFSEFNILSLSLSLRWLLCGVYCATIIIFQLYVPCESTFTWYYRYYWKNIFALERKRALNLVIIGV